MTDRLEIQGLQRRGRALYRAVRAEFELDPASVEVLLQLARTVDYCDLLAAKIAADDDTARNLAEFARQSANLARLAKSLDLPDDLDTSDAG